ncbi:MAG: ribosome biogenesis GTPase Der [Phycisphaerae bacterium]|nr:ribosome biogenesis GTPase Der [Phycisphaerae bacterium]
MIPKVAIVGRPNVGKSSLLNMLAGRRVSIVDAVPGVTRDRVNTQLDLPPASRGGPPRSCQVIDTGGYGVYSDDATYHVLTEDIEHQISVAVDEAQLVVFVLDAQAGVTPLDEQVAQLLRCRAAGRVPIVLAVNKVDDDKHEADAVEAANLGLGEPVTVSASTGRGKWDFIEAIADGIDWDAEPAARAESATRVAIVGKRNAGKSTFVNALAGSERVIVNELAGTTRDSIDVRIELDEHVFTVIDTAGARKRKSLEDDVEYYSLHRTLRSIRRADVVLLLVDATAPISQVDKKLSQHIQKHYKPGVIVINKWDLAEDHRTTDDYLDYISDMLRGLDFAPIIFTSAIRNDHVREALQTAVKLHEQASTRVGTGELNQAVRRILESRGPSSKLGTRARVYYVTQVTANPPTIVLFVNKPDLFSDQYQRYMINSFRDMLPFEEVPIRLVLRGRQRRSADRDEQPVAEA